MRNPKDAETGASPAASPHLGGCQRVDFLGLEGKDRSESMRHVAVFAYSCSCIDAGGKGDFGVGFARAMAVCCLNWACAALASTPESGCVRESNPVRNCLPVYISAFWCT